MATEQSFSTDVLVEIIRKLPPSSRRRARLVCRRWRDAVNERTTEMESRPMPLIWGDGVAYVIRDLSSESLWRTKLPTASHRSYPVGTCNGLLCICYNEARAGGALTVANPATGDTMRLPPLPCAGVFAGRRGYERWDAAYSFAYHPTTGRYKVVHVPCSYDRLCDFTTVQVLTLGETAWREVPPPAGGARCNLAAGVVSVDGVTHWVNVGGDTRIVSLDLDAECFASAAIPLPRLPDNHENYHLTEVHGRLGFVILPDVWVLEPGPQPWSLRYKLHVGVPRPHFVFADCVLTRRNGLGFFGHRPKSTPPSSWKIEREGVVRVEHGDHGTLVAKMIGRYDYFDGDWYRTLNYVETLELLSVYASN
jgi:F-box interacting protein